MTVTLDFTPHIAAVDLACRSGAHLTRCAARCERILDMGIRYPHSIDRDYRRYRLDCDRLDRATARLALVRAEQRRREGA